MKTRTADYHSSARRWALAMLAVAVSCVAVPQPAEAQTCVIPSASAEVSCSASSNRCTLYQPLGTSGCKPCYRSIKKSSCVLSSSGFDDTAVHKPISTNFIAGGDGIAWSLETQEFLRAFNNAPAFARTNSDSIYMVVTPSAEQDGKWEAQFIEPDVAEALEASKVGEFKPKIEADLNANEGETTIELNSAASAENTSLEKHIKDEEAIILQYKSPDSIEAFAVK